MRAVKIISWHLGAMAAVYGLQLHWLTGIFLMALMAVIWISVILNVLMIRIFYEVAVKKISWHWIILPLVFYVGWLGYTFPQVLRVQKQIHHVEQENFMLDSASFPDGTVYRFEPQSRRLAVLFEKYAANGPVYYGNRLISTVDTEERCSDAAKHLVNGRRHGSLRLRQGGKAIRRCFVSGEAEVPLQRIDFLRAERFGEVQNGIVSTLEINDVSGDRGFKRIGLQSSGLFRVPSYLPLFLLGCGLNSANGSWDCGFELLDRSVYFGGRQKVKIFGDSNGRALALAKMMGLPAKNSR